MLRPFERSARDARPTGVIYSGFDSAKHDRAAAWTPRQGLAGLFLGQSSPTALMLAIANAEGFNVARSIPQTANNPGDLELGDIGYGTLGEGITVFGSIDDGWAALANQINLIVTGSSSHYSPNATLAQVGQTWSGSSNWANNVAAYLGVSVNTPFASLAGETVAATPAASPAGAVIAATPTPQAIPTPWLMGAGAALVLGLVALT